MLFLVASALATDLRFYPGVGDELVDLATLPGAVGRTGELMVRGDLGALTATPGVLATRRGPLGTWMVRVHGDDLALARTLHHTHGITWAIPNVLFELQPTALPNDPFVGDEWHLENIGQGGRIIDVDIDAELAWSFTNGAGQRIAILDSGVELSHPDLTVVAGRDYLDDDDDPSPGGDDAAPHGTGAAGVAAAIGDNGVGVAGVAWGADVYAIRLIGGPSSFEDVADAFEEAVDAGATVLSNSWGYIGCERIPALAVYHEMFDYAEQQGRGGLGSAVVFAAGNDACDLSDNGMLGFDSVTAVAAVEWNDRRAWYSNWGEHVDLAAPTSLLTTDLSVGGYGSYGGSDAFVDGYSGTSAATPVVAGVFALMFASNTRLTAADAREVLCATAVRNDDALADYDETGWSPWYGCGRVDAGAAVAAVANVGAPGVPATWGAPTSIYDSRAQLVWGAALDPDNDALHYEVEWWTNPDDVALEHVDGLSLDLGAYVHVTDTLGWRVRAVDAWGAGAWTPTLELPVVADPEPPETDKRGCTTSTAGGLAAMAAGLLARRKRPAAPVPSSITQTSG